ncbi:uncharacterized protein LOC123705247 [Colias croceus]|uniref:uncharacterized protein LOC123705247 n=1 Tax=Colias crocea TaxID=72248 RepID=UPI001E27F6C7|nr:uncharacterized protein LOC123705247 [Colias croceus]
MRGPYRVVKALPHGRYELQLLAGSYGKSTQAAAEFMVPWRGEWTPEACAAFFEGAASIEDEESTNDRVVVDEPVPGTSRGACTSPHKTKENEDVLQSGEAVLDKN